jgi:hypothetical protein
MLDKEERRKYNALAEKNLCDDSSDDSPDNSSDIFSKERAGG